MSQQLAIETIRSGVNCFITGGAGRGKSRIIEEVYDESTVLLAPTGISALNIGGTTAHRALALPIGLITKKDEVTVPTRARDLFAREEGVKRVILDEISMIRCDVIDLIDKRLKLIRNNRLPFGGIQMVVVGDLYQLAPIVSRREQLHFKRKYKTPFCFGAACWDFKTITLTKNYRTTDSKQSAVLDSIRTQDVNFEESLKALRKDKAKYVENEDILHLCCYKDDAERINRKFYDSVVGTERTYTGIVSGDMKDGDMIVDKHLLLKVGTKVLVKANCPLETYCNGDRGVILGFSEVGAPMDEQYVEVELEGDGAVVQVMTMNWEKFEYSVDKATNDLEKGVSGKFSQIPLQLGYAITGHSSQGITLDNVAVHFGKGAFAHGLGYVMLSRIRNLDNLTFVKRQTPALFKKNFIIDNDVKNFYRELIKDL